jgi:hypothetical protein
MDTVHNGLWTIDYFRLWTMGYGLWTITNDNWVRTWDVNPRVERVRFD